MKIQDHYEFPECDHRRLPSSPDGKDGARWSDLSSRYSGGRKVGSPAGFYCARSVEYSPSVYTWCWFRRSAVTGPLKMGSIGSWMSRSGRMTAASGTERQLAIWPSC